MSAKRPVLGAALLTVLVANLVYVVQPRTDVVAVQELGDGVRFAVSPVHVLLPALLGGLAALCGVVLGFSVRRWPAEGIAGVVGACALAAPALFIMSAVYVPALFLTALAAGLALAWITVCVSANPVAMRRVIVRLSLGGWCLALALLLALDSVNAYRRPIVVGDDSIRIGSTRLAYTNIKALYGGTSSGSWFDLHDGESVHVKPGPVLERAIPELERASHDAGAPFEVWVRGSSRR